MSALLTTVRPNVGCVTVAQSVKEVFMRVFTNMIHGAPTTAFVVELMRALYARLVRLDPRTQDYGLRSNPR